MSQSPFRLGGCRSIPVVALLLAASLAQAQGSPARTERADPLDAQVRVPVVTYGSSLSSYRRLGDDRRTDWKEANETVNRIGGWRAYTREAQQPEAPASAPATSGAPAVTSRTAPAHGGHHKH